jgi:hypothetical protein
VRAAVGQKVNEGGPTGGNHVLLDMAGHGCQAQTSPAYVRLLIQPGRPLPPLARMFSTRHTSII